MSEQNLGFHHKLESLLRDCAVTNSEGYSEALEALRDMAPDLARRVLAAEKLAACVEAYMRCEVFNRDLAVAYTAYREACK